MTTTSTYTAIDAYHFMVRLWGAIKVFTSRRTGLWRLNAWTWNRRARQLEDLADDVAGVTPDGAALLRQRSADLRLAARQAAS